MKQGRFMLVADIGGTFSRFALCGLEESQDGLRLVLLEDSKVKLPTPEARNFSALLDKLREPSTPGGYALLPAAPQAGYTIVSAILAVPGAVDQGECFPPNIPWPITVKALENATGGPGFLLNDFAAQGHACLFPEILALRPALGGSPQKGHSSVVLGAGTGLGKAQILPPPDSWASAHGIDHLTASSPSCGPEAKGHARQVFIPQRLLGLLGALSSRVLPSEGGHALFPFQGEEEAAFEHFASARSGRKQIIGDMVVTGYGLALLYAFHTQSHTVLTPPEIPPLLPQAPLALEWLARFYGRACRNFVLETLGLGGVYLSGGILSHVPGLFGHPAFETEFRKSEGQGRLLAQVPVSWISNQDAGLWGSAIYGLGQYCNRGA